MTSSEPDAPRSRSRWRRSLPRSLRTHLASDHGGATPAIPSTVMARSSINGIPATSPGTGSSTRGASIAGRAGRSRRSLFTEAHGASVVQRQPDAGEETEAWLAAQACPTIVDRHGLAPPSPRAAVPAGGRAGLGRVRPGLLLGGQLRASAWFVVRPAGNVLVDSPRFTEALAGPIAELGGIDHVALTHRDDVADAHRWAERFGARTWIHADDRSAAPWATRRDHRRTGAAARLVADPGAGPHQGIGGLPARRHVAVHRRLLGLEPRTRRPDRVPRRLLVLVARPDRLARRARRRGTASPPCCPATAPATSATPTTCTVAWWTSSTACAADRVSGGAGPGDRGAPGSGRRRPLPWCPRRRPRDG